MMMSKNMLVRYLLAAVFSVWCYVNLTGCRNMGVGDVQCFDDTGCVGWFICNDSGNCVLPSCASGEECPDDSDGNPLACHASGYCGKPCTPGNHDECPNFGAGELGNNFCPSWGFCTLTCDAGDRCGEGNGFSCRVSTDDDEETLDVNGVSTRVNVCVPGDVLGQCLTAATATADNQEQCMACSFDKTQECLWCKEMSYIPDYEGSCAILCTSSETTVPLGMKTVEA